MSDTVSSGAPPHSSSEDRSLTFVVYALLFVAPFVAWLTALVAVVIAYVRRGMASPLERTHYAFQIRIFWVMIVLVALGVVAFASGIGIVLYDLFQSATNSGQGWDAWQVASVDEKDMHFHPISIVLVVVGVLIWLGAGLWTIIASIVGMARLAGEAPMGRLRG